MFNKLFNINRNSVEIDNHKVIKRYKNKKKFHSGLSAKESFVLEFNCLNSIKENYYCKCGYGNTFQHFPIILDYNMKKLELVISFMGPTIYSINPFNLEIPNLEKQCECIVDNLKRARVTHLDIHRNNLCLSEETLSLIDFDIAHIENEDVKTDLIKRRLTNHVNNKTIMVRNLVKTVLF